MKKISLLLIGLCVAAISMAQQNDTTVLRANNVFEVQRLQKVHVFDAKKDTCVLETQQYDKRGRLVYQKMDLRCIGYESYDESYYVYEGEKLIRMIMRRDNDNFVKVTYSYEDKGEEPVNVKTFFYQTNDSILSSTKYFRNRKGRMDSSHQTSIFQDGRIEKTKSVARYDKNNHLVELIVAGPDGNAREMMTNEIDKNGVVLSVGYATYGERDDFTQTFYKYTDKNQIESTMNNSTQKQEYMYRDNGLINNVLSYNPKGVLEIEFIYKYKYQE